MIGRWEWGVFAVSTTAGREWRYGSFWSHWGVHRTADKWFEVIHAPSGRRVTQFDRLGIARRFCEAINGLTDWTSVTGISDFDSALVLQVHRAALRVTGARPVLTLFAGGRGAP